MAAGLAKAPKLGPGALAKFVVTNKTAVASVARVATRVGAHAEEAHGAALAPFSWRCAGRSRRRAVAAGWQSDLQVARGCEAG
jgi:hypothetical protein